MLGKATMAEKAQLDALLKEGEFKDGGPVSHNKDAALNLGCMPFLRENK